jgi:RNA polymerase sigma factor (sigma-70 family)
MGIKGSDAEEAFSIGLVAITEAAHSFNPEKSNPEKGGVESLLAAWLAKHVRWGIQNWQYQERKHNNLYFVTRRGNGETMTIEPEDSKDVIELSEVMRETLALVQEVCDETEQRVIMSLALGYTNQEICRKFGMTPVQVTRAKKRARFKLEQYR